MDIFVNVEQNSSVISTIFVLQVKETLKDFSVFQNKDIYKTLSANLTKTAYLVNKIVVLFSGCDPFCFACVVGGEPLEWLCVSRLQAMTKVEKHSNCFHIAPLKMIYVFFLLFILG